MINILIGIFIFTTGFFIFAYSISFFKKILSLVFFWQLKEYRLDRMWAYFKTWQGRKIIFNFPSFAKWFLLTAFLIIYFRSSNSFLDFLFLFILPVTFYFLEGFWSVIQLLRRRWIFPKLTLKTLLLIFSGVVFGLVVYLLIKQKLTFNDWPFIFVVPLLIDKLLGAFIALMVVFLAIPSIIYKKYLIRKAKKKLQNYPNLKVIGITGSYGKTSTKKFLAQILSSKFKVLKTTASQNTTWGVAKTILNNLTDQEIFVAEMGAYRIGEIREICQIVKPQIGIITGINEQHLDLFGNLEKTMEAKYELIESLSTDGLAIFNGNNQYSLKMAEKARQKGVKLILYRCIDSSIQTETKVLADKIKVSPGKLEFEVRIANEKQKMSASLLGAQNVENILGAVAVADYLGMSLEEIARTIEKLEAPERTMKLHNNLVDDTFNTNPDGVLAALEYMKVYPGKKILILTPMIELGKYAGEAHEKVGKKAVEVCDLIILTNKNYYRDFRKGFKRNGGIEGKLIVAGGNKAAEKIRKVLGKDGVAVFEGRESKRILEDLKKNLKYPIE